MRIAYKKDLDAVRAAASLLAPEEVDYVKAKGKAGPVKVYKLGEPMGWAAFADMPEDLQKRYIELLASKYGVNLEELSSMFGEDEEAVLARLAELGLKVDRHEVTWEQAEAWEKFMACE